MSAQNNNIKMNDIRNNIDLPWNYDWLSFNPNLEISFVKEHPTEKWNYTYMSQNINITMNDVLENINFPWDYSASLAAFWRGLGESRVPGLCRPAALEPDT